MVLSLTRESSEVRESRSCASEAKEQRSTLAEAEENRLTFDSSVKITESGLVLSPAAAAARDLEADVCLLLPLHELRSC